MAIFNSILTWAMKKRIHQMELFLQFPADVQRELLFALVNKSKNTEWGVKYGYKDITTIAQFQEQVPISSYEELYPYIERLMKGESNILWPTKIEWFSKSSGTTNDRSKFIPVSPEALEDCHYKAGKDMLSLYVNNFPAKAPFAGKSLVLGGTHQINHLNPKTSYGDVSGVIMENLPWWAQLMRTPSLKIALLDTWEFKIEKMAEETIKQNVTSLAGVPTWTLVLLQRILEQTGKKNLLEIWPNLELFVHGAVSFDPYRALFKELIPTDQMNYQEVYNASEGFFAIQDDPTRNDLLLMLDYGIFYEFIPMEEWNNEHPTTYTIGEVELNKNYAVVISTNAGLWRYKIGDTVRFTSKEPYRIKITGRTKHFINAFGEEVVIENAEDALTFATKHTNALISNYTAAPIYFSQNNNGGHEWLIEFDTPPSDFNKFCELLDQRLREINSDYDAKRYQDIALSKPKVHLLEKGTFYKWMNKRGKLGGQNKVPRLANTREYIDDILEMLRG